MRGLGCFAVLLCLAGAARSDDWPQWRGPEGTGVAQEQGIPSRWQKDAVTWKARLGGKGVSSPVVLGDRIFVTSQLGRGTLREGPHPTLARGEEAKRERPLGADSADERTADAGGVAFLVEAFARRDGHRLWQHRAPAAGALPPVHEKNNLAYPSPVTDGRFVYAWFGNGQLMAVDVDGRLAWERQLGRDYGAYDIDWGHGSSPALYQDLLILLCDHKPAAYLLALDKRSGRERWRVDREKGSISYSTPTLLRGPRGDELVVNSTLRVDAYDPRTGARLWWAGDPQRFAVPVPAYHDGLLYMSRGYRSGPYMAVQVGGRGDVTKTHVRWLVETGAPYVSSLLYYQGLVYMANDVGILAAIDPGSGEKVWQERVDGIFTASPVAADEKIYFVGEDGDTVVLKAGRPPGILSRNSLGERSVASPAISGGQIFIRTDDHLICVGRARSGGAAGASASARPAGEK